MIRRYPLVTGHVYHVMNKSIEGYQIFNNQGDYEHMKQLLRYFSLKSPPTKFSFFIKRDPGVLKNGFDATVSELAQHTDQLVDNIAYCLMPTHFHLVVKQIYTNGISELLRKSLNGYARYFNTKYKRKGTLWMSRFKNVLVENDMQLLHLTRYVHLNPVTAGLVKNPDDWKYSSYPEYVKPGKNKYPLTIRTDLLDINPVQYKEFVVNHASYQRELSLIKQQIIE